MSCHKHGGYGPPKHAGSPDYQECLECALPGMRATLRRKIWAIRPDLASAILNMGYVELLHLSADLRPLPLLYVLEWRREGGTAITRTLAVRTTNRNRGTGIALGIARKFARKHGYQHYSVTEEGWEWENSG
jgi:hypothetical protein